MSPSNPLISTSKQNRIDIWRTEVAAMTFPPTNPPTPGSSVTTETSSSSTSTAGSSPLQPPEQEQEQEHQLDQDLPSGRRRNLWRRITRRVIGLRKDGQGPSLPASAFFGISSHDPFDQGIRTEMYKGLKAKLPTPDEEVAPGAESSHNDDLRRRQLQERLDRAATLLDRGIRD